MRASVEREAHLWIAMVVVALFLLSWWSLSSSTEAFVVVLRPGARSVSKQPPSARAAAAAEDYASRIAAAREVLVRASETKKEASDAVVESLLSLEQACRERGRVESNEAVAASLDGSWRLVFTTGTIDTQKATGTRINYFPVKAVQSFDFASNRISNGIFIGDFALLRFFGDFSFDVKSKKLEFDFDRIQVLGLVDVPLNGGASRIGAATGLGSKNNEQLVQRGKLPFFNWIDADDDIATARGGGGGLALWKRTEPIA